MAEKKEAEKKEVSKADLCRSFLQKNPQGTFKDFNAEQPDVLTSAYFATMKSILKKRGDEPPKKRGRPAKITTEAPATPKKRGRPAKSAETAAAPKKASNGRGRPKIVNRDWDLQGKIDLQRDFLTWVEAGMARGFVDRLKDHL